MKVTERIRAVRVFANRAPCEFCRASFAKSKERTRAKVIFYYILRSAIGAMLPRGICRLLLTYVFINIYELQNFQCFFKFRFLHDNFSAFFLKFECCIEQVWYYCIHWCLYQVVFFFIFCKDDSEMLSLSKKLSKFSMMFYRETSQLHFSWTESICEASLNSTLRTARTLKGLKTHYKI